MTSTREHVFIGVDEDADREKVYVSVQLSRTTRPQQSVAHDDVPAGALILGLTSVSIRRKGSIERDSDWTGFGQIGFGHLDTSRSEWSNDDVARLREVSKRWHLNHVNAGCLHQEVVWEEVPYRHPSLTRTLPCPVTGYRYGSSWLYEPLPDDVVEFICRVFDIKPPA